MSTEKHIRAVAMQKKGGLDSEVNFIVMIINCVWCFGWICFKIPSF